MAFQVARSMMLKGVAAAGTATLGIAYYQRRQPTYSDHRIAWGEGATTRFYRGFVVPVISCFDPELVHSWTIQVARFWQEVRLVAVPAWTGESPVDWLLRPPTSVGTVSGPNLVQELFNGRVCFRTPIGLAAGFDKNAELVPLYRLGDFPGLGFSEVGSVTALPSDGNPRPRCWRLPFDGAAINRVGLYNQGAERVAERLKRFERLAKMPGRAPVGINIAKTPSQDILGDAAVTDMVASFTALQPHADFVVLNVSCPNTKDGKTFEDREALQQLLGAVADARSSTSPPVLLKISPPQDSPEGEEHLRQLVSTALESGIVDGFVVSNTAGDRNVRLSKKGADKAEEVGRGGLSGRPLFQRSTLAVKIVYKLTDGRVPIIATGGVDSAETAYAKIRAGASLVEVYTGLAYKGPGLLSDLHSGLRWHLERDGFTSVSEAIGADHRGAVAVAA